MEITQIRQKSVWYWPDWIWNLTPLGNQQNKNVDKMHHFTEKVIKQRWEHYKELKGELGDAFEATYFAEKCDSRGRMAFLGDLELRSICKNFSRYAVKMPRSRRN